MKATKEPDLPQVHRDLARAALHMDLLILAVAAIIFTGWLLLR